MESFEDITLITPDGVKIKAFVMLSGEKPEVRPTVILCHANAGNVVRTATLFVRCNSRRSVLMLVCCFFLVDIIFL